MRVLSIWFLLAVLSLPALAAIKVEVNARMKERDCQWLVRHHPSDDVAYKPGVDVRGNPVKPADLDDSGKIEAPDKIDIDIIVPIRVLNRPGGVRGEARLGYVTVDTKTGAVSYNGKPLSGTEKSKLAAFCRNRTRN